MSYKHFVLIKPTTHEKSWVIMFLMRREAENVRFHADRTSMAHMEPKYALIPNLPALASNDPFEKILRHVADSHIEKLNCRRYTV